MNVWVYIEGILIERILLQTRIPVVTTVEKKTRNKKCCTTFYRGEMISYFFTETHPLVIVTFFKQ